MHRELAPAGIDIVTVCLDLDGRSGAAPDLAAVNDPSHIAVVDPTHAVDAALGIVNVPMAVWIDEELRIVRPAEAAWPDAGGGGRGSLPADLPERVARMAATAGRIAADRAWYSEALRDWAANGSDSAWVLPPEQVKAASVPRGRDQAAAAAHFELAQHLHREVGPAAAVEHFRAAHRLDPDNWTYKRQAWELASRVGGPLSRFWQGPVPGQEQDWPYEGDWLSDIEAIGPENYYPPSAGPAR